MQSFLLGATILKIVKDVFYSIISSVWKLTGKFMISHMYSPFNMMILRFYDYISVRNPGNLGNGLFWQSPTPQVICRWWESFILPCLTNCARPIQLLFSSGHFHQKIMLINVSMFFVSNVLCVWFENLILILITCITAETSKSRICKRLIWHCI